MFTCSQTVSKAILYQALWTVMECSQVRGWTISRYDFNVFQQVNTVSFVNSAVLKVFSELSFLMGGTEASWLVLSTPGRAVWVRALARKTVNRGQTQEHAQCTRTRSPAAKISRANFIDTIAEPLLREQKKLNDSD